MEQFIAGGYFFIWELKKLVYTRYLLVIAQKHSFYFLF